MKQYVTIKEFASLANITTQAVYKRINQDINFQQYIKFDGKYKLINTEALKIFAEEAADYSETDIPLPKPEPVTVPEPEKAKPEPVAVPEPEKEAKPEPEPEKEAKPEPAAEQKSNNMLPVSDIQFQILNNTTDKLVSSLENHIDDLKKEIQTLRNELAEKNMQLSNLNERLANEQELHRHNQLLLVSTQDEKQEKEPEKQSGFFKKIFGK